MQMANKPSVQAALKIKNVISMRNFQIIYNFNLKLFQKTLKQRLAAPNGVNRPNFGAQREANSANRQVIN